jgi:hypothetical protein
MTAKLSLGDTALTVRVARLLASCPNFEEPLPYEVHSPVTAEAFGIFVAALEGAPPAIPTKNMNDRLLLCNEFGFVSLHTHVSDFISAHSVVDGEVRKRVNDIEEKSGQQNRRHCLLQKDPVELRKRARGRRNKLRQSAARRQSQTKK